MKKKLTRRQKRISKKLPKKFEVYGNPLEGKSSAVYKWAEENGYKVTEIRAFKSEEGSK